jgi:hypothetical protein
MVMSTKRFEHQNCSYHHQQADCVSIHMLYHMYVVHSAEAPANLSSIEILWYLGKNRMSIGTVHIIDHCVSIHHLLSMIDPHAVSHVTLMQISPPLKSYGIWARIA